ncbi:MAG: Ldh family oxidoreductase [Dehalococcoidia bacterium]
MSNATYKPDQLRELCIEVFRKLGLKREEAEIISGVLIEADLRGISSHGIARLPIYAKRIRLGLINPNPEPRILKENETAALLDADNGMGHIASYKAMEICIDKAKRTGTGSVAVKNSNHFGINAYYTMMAARKNVIGMAFTNTSPLMVPFGGSEKLLGSNPLSIAIPAGSEPDLVLDMATSVAPRGKLEDAARKGLSIPEGWAVDKGGRVTVDPKEGLSGALLPFGGPKGYGLAICVDIMCGVLTGSDFGPNCGALFGDLDRPQNIGHFFMAINIENYMSIGDFKERMDTMVRTIKESNKAPGVDRIYMPGEIEYEKSIELRKTGITLTTAVVNELNDLAESLGIPEVKRI